MRLILTILLTALSGVSSLGQAQDAKPLQGFDVVEFRMTNFASEDGYPRYVATDSNGPLGPVQMSLRCSEGYDGNVVWKYKEIMVFDEKGKVIKRKEPRGNVASEKGYRFEFPTMQECDKASATVLSEGSVCLLVLQLNRKRSIAKLASAKCSERSAPVSDTPHVPLPNKKPTSQ